MNNFAFQYPVRQYFGNGCAADVSREAADTCVLTAGYCRKFTRDEIYDILVSLV